MLSTSEPFLSAIRSFNFPRSLVVIHTHIYKGGLCFYSITVGIVVNCQSCVLSFARARPVPCFRYPYSRCLNREA